MKNKAAGKFACVTNREDFLCHRIASARRRRQPPCVLCSLVPEGVAFSPIGGRCVVGPGPWRGALDSVVEKKMLAVRPVEQWVLVRCE